jgi:hypothetical protein
LAAPPLILGALLLALAWRTRERLWRLATAALGLACIGYGGGVAWTEPEAFETNRPAGSVNWVTSPRWP